MGLDERLSHNGVGADLRLEVDWAPAYELVVSLGCYLHLGSWSALELGQPWARTVQRQLPTAAAAHFSRKSVARSFKEHDCDLITQLILACPTSRDVAGFLDWFAQLTAGAAYEALAARSPEPGPRLPRDFTTWRDTTLDMLGTWYAGYFRHTDPAIFEGLSQAAEQLRARARATRHAQELVEEVTNGLIVEPSAEIRHVVLVPQYHNRPYNQDTEIQAGVLILYPCEAVAPPEDMPPRQLLRLAHALSDESRLRILRFLANGPCSLTEAARFAGLSQPTVHHHLTTLRAAGLVRIHFVKSNPNRYSMRPHALEQLSRHLGAYLHSTSPEKEASNHGSSADLPRAPRALSR